MNNISLQQVNSIKCALRETLGEEAKWIDTEIQDGGDFLLVLVETTFSQSCEFTEKMLKTATSVMNAEIQSKQGEIAWMVNICHREALLDSAVCGEA